MNLELERQLWNKEVVDWSFEQERFFGRIGSVKLRKNESISDFGWIIGDILELPFLGYIHITHFTRIISMNLDNHQIVTGQNGIWGPATAYNHKTEIDGKGRSFLLTRYPIWGT